MFSTFLKRKLRNWFNPKKYSLIKLSLINYLKAKLKIFLRVTQHSQLILAMARALRWWEATLHRWIWDRKGKKIKHRKLVVNSLIIFIPKDGIWESFESLSQLTSIFDLHGNQDQEDW